MKVKTLGQLVMLAYNHKAVYSLKCPAFKRRIPAAFVVNFPGHYLHRLLIQGLYVWKSKKIKKMLDIDTK